MHSEFRCKKFNIYHGNGVFKVNTDGLLLGAMSTPICGDVLDIGTGSGIVSLAYAQRCLDAKITGIDIHESSIKTAKINFEKSPWSNRLTVKHIDLKNLPPSWKYDLIISNPPYYMEGTKPKRPELSRAKHTSSQMGVSLLSNAIRLHLTKKGTASIIAPLEYQRHLEERLKIYAIYPNRKIYIYGKASKPFKRVLTEYTRKEISIKAEKLVMYEEGGNYTMDYLKIARPYLYI